MTCYEIKTENTTYYASVIPGRYARDPLLALAFNDRPTAMVYGGRFSVIENARWQKGGYITGESSGRRVRSSIVRSVRRISKKRFMQVA
jgi:hypothetical protein